MAGTTAGLTFGPPTQGMDPAQRRASGSLKPSASPVDVLSLQLPKMLGGGAITPRSLLQPDPGSPMGGGGFSPESAVLQSVMRTLPQFSRGASAAPPAGPMAAPPSPSAMGLPAVAGAPSGQQAPAAMGDILAMLRAALSGGPAGPRVTG